MIYLERTDDFILKYKKSFVLRNYKKLLYVRARKCHFPKYKEFLRGGFFFFFQAWA